jgi:predicted nucleic acid-binding protein
MRPGILMDTNVLSEMKRLEPDRHVLAWMAQRPTGTSFMSVITIGEIWSGIGGAADDVYRARLLRWLEVDLRLAFEGRILAVDERVARAWGAIHTDNRKQPVNVTDELIAATAQANGLTVATRNIRDFERCGVPTFNPWEFE